MARAAKYGGMRTKMSGDLEGDSGSTAQGMRAHERAHDSKHG